MSHRTKTREAQPSDRRTQPSDRRVSGNLRRALLAAGMATVLLAACAGKSDVVADADADQAPAPTTDVGESPPEEPSQALGEHMSQRLDVVNEQIVSFVNSHENTPDDPVATNVLEDPEDGEVTYMIGRQDAESLLSIMVGFELGADGNQGEFTRLSATRFTPAPGSDRELDQTTLALVWAPNTFSDRANGWIASGGTQSGYTGGRDFDFSTDDAVPQGLSAMEQASDEVLNIASQLVNDTIGVGV